MLISPSVPCRKHWDVTRQIKSLAQLIQSAQNGWGGDLWLLCEGFWRGRAVVWPYESCLAGIHSKSGNSTGSSEGKKDVTSCHLNGILNSKHISGSNCARPLPLKWTQRKKWNLSLFCIFEHFCENKEGFWVKGKFQRDHIYRINSLTFNWSECLKLLLVAVQLHHL